MVAENTLSAQERATRDSYVGCIAGALTFDEYRRGLADAGFTDIEITPTHQVADRMHSAIIRATKPATTPDGAAIVGATIPTSSTTGCCQGVVWCASRQRPKL
ncbi:hypothetical protein [Fodinicola acaciae]|uniref:hypothetical protein n=1 Tax=Fodinicola acaciae TaxID=2681555 RepID=UPI0013D7795F|nr:hypothetical protein [Fodinicola acaciae]